MIKEIKAPSSTIDSVKFSYSIFLAGSIEMGKAELWQDTFVEKIKKYFTTDKSVLIYNPRRDDWNGSLEQVYENDVLKNQINWELNALEKSTFVYFYFDPKTSSPITLLELGRFYNKNIVVNCPDGYFRKANVDIFCERYGIRQVSSMEEAIDYFAGKVNNNEN